MFTCIPSSLFVAKEKPKTKQKKIKIEIDCLLCVFSDERKILQAKNAKRYNARWRRNSHNQSQKTWATWDIMVLPPQPPAQFLLSNYLYIHFAFVLLRSLQYQSTQKKQLIETAWLFSICVTNWNTMHTHTTIQSPTHAIRIHTIGNMAKTLCPPAPDTFNFVIRPHKIESGRRRRWSNPYMFSTFLHRLQS